MTTASPWPATPTVTQIAGIIMFSPSGPPEKLTPKKTRGINKRLAKEIMKDRRNPVVLCLTSPAPRPPLYRRVNRSGQRPAIPMTLTRHLADRLLSGQQTIATVRFGCAAFRSLRPERRPMQVGIVSFRNCIILQFEAILQTGRQMREFLYFRY